MTDDLEPFTRKELQQILSEKKRKADDDKYAKEVSPAIIREIYQQFRRDMENSDNRKSYSSDYTLRNLNTERYTNVNEIVLARICELFPDFMVRGRYVNSTDDILWFTYEISVEWF
jgi:hypothetical protein